MQLPTPPAAEKLFKFLAEQEAQRSRTARILHDEVSQVLSAIGLHLDVLRMDFQERHPELAERTAEIQQLLEKAIDEVRDLGRDLDPAMVERAGLHSALSRMVGLCRETHGTPVRLLMDPAARLPIQTANAFYRIAEQALENALRHAGAAAVEVLLRPSRAGVVLEIRDEGPGFDVEEARAACRGLGILLMEYYSSRAGLEFLLTSTPGRGTIVKAVFRSPEGASSTPE